MLKRHDRPTMMMAHLAPSRNAVIAMCQIQHAAEVAAALLTPRGSGVAAESICHGDATTQGNGA
jgi:hypothetical protein